MRSPFFLRNGNQDISEAAEEPHQVLFLRLHAHLSDDTRGDDQNLEPLHYASEQSLAIDFVVVTEQRQQQQQYWPLGLTPAPPECHCETAARAFVQAEGR
jgi:hypothetical protein